MLSKLWPKLEKLGLGCLPEKRESRGRIRVAQEGALGSTGAGSDSGKWRRSWITKSGSSLPQSASRLQFQARGSVVTPRVWRKVARPLGSTARVRGSAAKGERIPGYLASGEERERDGEMDLGGCWPV